MDEVRKIADAVLYEGYILWPYRRSAMKNQQRWTFGGVYPEAYSRARGEDDPWTMQTQILVEGGDDASVEVRVRFLHVVERQVAAHTGDDLELVDELTVDGRRHLSWDEAAEREVTAPGLRLAALKTPERMEISVPTGSEREELLDAEGGIAGEVLRSWRSLAGAVEIRAERLRPRLHRLTIRIVNQTPWEGGRREDALRHTFVSTHTSVSAADGELVSLTDPPEDLRAEAEACENSGTWPVLVGTEGERHTLLSSPIILPDYPQIAPESPGDLFDAGEIDQMLVLNILSLTDEEKEEMRDSDPRTREILERTAALSPEEMMSLHGAIREFQAVRAQ
ncbi:MAG: hypothetical protein ACR2NV_05190 [Thermoleophilaceae bacterium]|jgi:hypothetical protein